MGRSNKKNKDIINFPSISYGLESLKVTKRKLISAKTAISIPITSNLSEKISKYYLKGFRNFKIKISKNNIKIALETIKDLSNKYKKESLVISDKEENIQDTKEIMQCFGCGYSTNTDLPDSIENATEMNDELKSHAKEANDKVWIPSMFQLDYGMLYPLSELNSLMWGFAEMVDIPKEEQKNYPDGQGGFYTKRYDNENELWVTIRNQVVTTILRRNENDKKFTSRVGFKVENVEYDLINKNSKCIC